MERVAGIEPARSAWEADRLPLHHTRLAAADCHRASASVNGTGLNAAVDRLVPSRRQHFPKLAGNLACQALILRADDEIRPNATLFEERVAADGNAGVRLLGLAQQVGDLAFGSPGADGHGHQRP